MKLLGKYMKPYLGYVVAVILLLFCQSSIDLILPNMMSDIVNVGIQNHGIDTAAPEAIDANSYQLMVKFMSDENRELVTSSYVLADKDDMSQKDWDHFTKKWPEAESRQIMKRTKSSEKLEAAFSQAGAVLKTLMEEDGLENHDPSALASVTEDQINAAIKESQTMNPELLSQTGTFLTKVFYENLGADIGSIQNRYILKVGAQMLLAALLLTAFAISAAFCTSRLGTGVARDMRRDFFAHVTDFTSREYNRFGASSLITRCTNDVMQIRGLLSSGLKAACYAPILGIGGTIMALYKSPGMAWVIALTGIIILGIMTLLFLLAVPRFKIMQKLVDKLNLVSRENLSGMMVIRAFSTQKFEEERFDKANKELTGNTLFISRAMATMMPVMMFVMNGVSLLIVWVGGHKIAESALQVGDMMAFIQYTMQIILSFLMISMIFVMVPRAIVSANRIEEVMNCTSSILDDESPLHLPEKVEGVIEFKDVSFNYEGADENVLEHISFTAKPGETTAFIGSTGSGKSTLVNLIPRFFDVTTGSITLDGIDIRKLPRKELRDAIGYIPQKGILFSGDIASNLQFGKEDASEEEMGTATRIAQAEEFISELPDGLHTSISQGGTNVSGGQRQRLSIARALTKNAPVYIFDDSFSALDFKTDAKLRQALNAETKHATTLIVAQRISTIMQADQIIVLEDGRIAGIGTHKELLENCDIYREIAKSQLSKEELA